LQHFCTSATIISTMDETVRSSWEKFLDPDVLRSNLIMASVYIAAFETLKTTIVEQIRSFYVTGFDSSVQKDGGLLVDSSYQTRVLSRSRSPVYASLDWLKESHAIDDDDVATFERAKACRNEITHGINQVLSGGLPADLPDRFTEMVALVDKIGRWWVVNVEIPTNPDFDGEEIDEAGIVPGPTIGLRLLMDIALGTEEESQFYITEFLNHTRQER
jgi:hypothetical protein